MEIRTRNIKATLREGGEYLGNRLYIKANPNGTAIVELDGVDISRLVKRAVIDIRPRHIPMVTLDLADIPEKYKDKIP